MSNLVIGRFYNELPDHQKKVIVAHKGKKICETPDKNIVQSLTKCMFYVGIGPDQLPSKEEFIGLITFIKDNYKGVKIKELVLAFEYGAANRYPKRPKVYGRITPIIISEYLSLYQDYVHKEKILKKFYETQGSASTKSDFRIFAEKLVLNNRAFRNVVVKHFIKIENGEDVTNDNYLLGEYFVFLEKVNIISMSNSEKEDILNKVTEYEKSRAESTESYKLKKLAIEDFLKRKKGGSMIDLARKKALTICFKKLVDEGVDSEMFEEILKNHKYISSKDVQQYESCKRKD